MQVPLLKRSPARSKGLFLRAEILVALRQESRRADRQENQVVVTRISDRLGCASGNENHIARHNLRNQVTYRCFPSTREDDVALGRVDESVEAGLSPAWDPSTGDGYLGIGRYIAEFENEAAFFKEIFLILLRMSNLRRHYSQRLTEALYSMYSLPKVASMRASSFLMK